MRHLLLPLMILHHLPSRAANSLEQAVPEMLDQPLDAFNYNNSEMLVQGRSRPLRLLQTGGLNVAPMASASYEFLQAECTVSSQMIFSDSSPNGFLGRILIDNKYKNSWITCLDGSGIASVVGLKSDSPVAMQTEFTFWGLATIQFSFELWLQSSTRSTAGNRCIMAVKFNLANGGEQFVIYQNNAVLTLTWWSFDDSATITINMPSGVGAFHLVSTISVPPEYNSNWQWIVYLNGVQQGNPTAKTPKAGQGNSWTAASKIYFLSDPGFNHYFWVGRIYRFAFYERALTPSEVKANYNAKILGRPPKATTPGLTNVPQYGMNDAMVKANPWLSLNLPWPVSLLPTIQLKVTDTDLTDQLSPNYDPTGQLYPVAYIETLPLQGLIFDASRQTQLRVGSTVGTKTAVATVAYQPIGSFTGSDSFTFSALSGWGIQRGVPVTVAIMVQAVHMPPKAVNSSVQVVAGFDLTTSLQYVNNGAGMSKAMLTQMPTKGNVYQVSPTGQSQALITNTRTDILPNANGQIRVLYRYMGSQLLPEIGRGIIAIDLLRFQVYDTLGYPSLPSQVNISIMIPYHPLPYNATVDIRAGRYTVFELNSRGGRGEINGTYITVLPTAGQLFQACTNGSVFRQQPINTTQASVVNCEGSYCVAYVYTSEQKVPADGIVASDSLSFRVTDDSGDASMRDGRVNLVIMSSLEAYLAGPAREYTLVPRNTPTVLTMYGNDYQDPELRRPPCFQLLAIPYYGTLYRITEPYTRIATEDIWSDVTTFSSNGLMTQVLYEPMQDYFNWPQDPWTEAITPQPLDAFTYRVISCDQSLVSPGLEQTIVVQYVNHPTYISNSYVNTTLQIYALGSLSPLREDNRTSDTLNITGFQVWDPDYNIDPVLVHVWAENGIVELNPVNLKEADFVSMQFCNANNVPHCYGSGEGLSMSFQVRPSQIGDLLNGLLYRSKEAVINDTLNVAVFDGAGGDYCFPNSAFDADIDRSSGCLTSNVTLHVQVGMSALIWYVETERAYGSLPLGFYFALVFLLTFVSLLILTLWLEMIEERLDGRRRDSFVIHNHATAFAPDKSLDPLAVKRSDKHPVLGRRRKYSLMGRRGKGRGRR